ncbi:adenine phosphoribosyltransferase [Williamsia sterculiae]|uniref:Adenine phosphoribosyltransferase n=1 Tax=Williamsia sterculiae TaxID=1344003 RepID=A0A1N7EH58_9NOCA|nr:adenine phosphoribosyltransferase [Williamsia sterculiae]SIR87338.1 adenine phosphoribosyltransferase [Williamsia sterculiae]
MTPENPGSADHDPDEPGTAKRVIDRLTRRVADFPEPGIQFKDLTPVLADPDGLRAVVDGLLHDVPSIDVVAGIDARGFLIGGAVALRRDVGVLAIRKAGKLPPPVHTREYQLEYGAASLELPADGLDIAGKRVLVVDDVLATGGTVLAAVGLLRECGAQVVAVSTIMEIADIPGRRTVQAELGPDVPLLSLTEG